MWKHGYKMVILILVASLPTSKIQKVSYNQIEIDHFALVNNEVFPHPEAPDNSTFN